MTEKLNLYQCEVCKTIIQVLVEGKGELVCCDKPMKHLSPNTEENVKLEYHLPIVLKVDDEEFIQVGKEPHPMTEEHYIQIIQTISECGKKVFTRLLEPNSEPKIKVEFDNFGDYKINEYCNIHGLWESKKS